MALSRRAQAIAEAATELNPFDILRNIRSETNPNGYISLGVAENSLMREELTEFINSSFRLQASHLTYGESCIGSSRLRQAVAAFMNRHFHPFKLIEPEHVLTTGGAGVALEQLAFLLSDHEEGAYLLGRPYYHAFKPDFRIRAGMKTVEVAFGTTDPFSPKCVVHYENALKDASKLVKVRALVLCSPHNPLGRCYPRQTIIEIMKLCQKYRIHLISDEIYALSVWKNDDAPNAEPFTSVLSINLAGIIDPELVHVVWGMSKDFGANGLRVGYIVSQHNKELHQAMKLQSFYTFPSYAADHICANILEDTDFTERYIQLNRQRLADNYAYATSFLQEHGIPYYRLTNAGFFLWVDLKRASRKARHPVGVAAGEMEGADIHDGMIDSKSRQRSETTKEIMKKLLDHKIFLASSTEFGGEEEGWFRIVFSHERAYLEEGLRRVVKAVSDSGRLTTST